MDASVDISVRKLLIKKQPVFAPLAEAEIEELAGLFAEKRITTGETIVKEGDPVDSIFLIVSGSVDVCHVTVNNGASQSTSVAVLGIGDAIGLNETGFYSLSGLRTATVVAMTDMVVLRLSVAAFHGFALSHSHVSELMHKHAEKILSDKF